MKPLGRKPVKFPSKVDHHPHKPDVNWWENNSNSANKTSDKQTSKKQIEKEINNL